MKINSESILTLDANKTYYIANSTGEIKEAGLWQRFKCFTGLGDGRAKVRRLAEEVKSALLRDGGIASENKLNEEIGRLDLTSSISGEKLREIATRFRADHADSVAKADAGRFAEARAESFVTDRTYQGSRGFRIHPDPANLGYMKRIATMAAKSVIGNVDASTDRDQLSLNVNKRLNSLSMMIDAAINIHGICCEKRDTFVKPDGTTGHLNLNLPVLRNELSFKVFASCLFKPDGPMRDGGMAALMLTRFPARLLTGGVKDAILAGKVPMDLVKTCNDAFLAHFDPRKDVDISDLHNEMVDELRNEMVARYGNALADNRRISSFASEYRIHELLGEVVARANGEGRLVRGDEIKDALRGEVCRGAAKLLVIDYATKFAAAHNLPKPDVSFGVQMDMQNPGMIDDIAAATTPEEAQAAVKRYDAQIQALLNVMKDTKAAIDGLAEKAIDRIAAGTGMNRDAVADQLQLFHLKDKARLLGEDIISAKHPGCREAGFSVEDAFKGILDRFVKARVDLLNEIENEKGLNAAGKAAFKRIVLTTEKPDVHHPGPIVNIVNGGTVTAKDFKDALNAEDDDAIAAGLVGIGGRIHEKMVEVYGAEKWEDIGADGRDAGIEMLLNKLVTEDEELAALFQAKRGKIEPWLGRAASPLHDDPVATKMLFLVYNALFPQDE